MMRMSGRAMATGALEQRLEAVRAGPGATLVAIEWGPPSGVVSLSWFPVLDADMPIAQINMFLVGAEDRRRGIGRMLLKAAAQTARNAGCGEMRMIVPDGADDLTAFCGATGFDRIATLFVRPLRKRA